MRPFTTVRSNACPILSDDIDTDQIIPKQYLKRIERTGFGPFAFAEWRYEADGVTPAPGLRDEPARARRRAGAAHRTQLRLRLVA
jgi:3-isopropylmalate/(R)-2-methylmalate dehydratase small subunit